MRRPKVAGQRGTTCSKAKILQLAKQNRQDRTGRFGKTAPGKTLRLGRGKQNPLMIWREVVRKPEG